MHSFKHSTSTGYSKHFFLPKSTQLDRNPGVETRYHVQFTFLTRIYQILTVFEEKKEKDRYHHKNSVLLAFERIFNCKKNREKLLLDLHENEPSSSVFREHIYVLSAQFTRYCIGPRKPSNASELTRVARGSGATTLWLHWHTHSLQLSCLQHAHRYALRLLIE